MKTFGFAAAMTRLDEVEVAEAEEFIPILTVSNDTSGAIQPLPDNQAIGIYRTLDFLIQRRHRRISHGHFADSGR